MWSGLTVTRKVFSSPNGKSVRHLDILTNNFATTVSAEPSTLSVSPVNGTPTLVATPAAASNQYAYPQPGRFRMLALGVVMQEPTYTVPVS